MAYMRNIITLLRPHQWLKNLFIFLPLFFSRHLVDWEYIYPCIISFVAYCFAASSVYCFNDIWDVASDRLHPKKCKRPIASGKISRKEGYWITLICIMISLLLAILGTIDNHHYLLKILCFYIIVNIAYCIKLKQIAIVDVFIIAIGFVLRIFAGGLVANIYISQWIVLMTFLLALFLAFAKRRDDVVIYEDTGMKVRRNVNRYNLQFMNQALAIIASVTMVCYIMYTSYRAYAYILFICYFYFCFSWYNALFAIDYSRCKKWESNQNINERLIYTNMYP